MTATTHPLALCGTFYFPLSGETGVTVMRDGCSAVVYPKDLSHMQADVETSVTGTIHFHGVPLDESDLISIRVYARRMGVLA